jgi:hypothetical protein
MADSGQKEIPEWRKELDKLTPEKQRLGFVLSKASTLIPTGMDFPIGDAAREQLREDIKALEPS